MPDTPIRYPDLPSELSGRLNWRTFKYFGAGAILASVTIGSGETLFGSRGGALFGYALLWCFVGGAIMKGIQVYVAARQMTLMGTHPMTYWSQLPGPRNWFPILLGMLSLACFPFWLAGLPMILGETINWIFGIANPADKADFLFWTRIWASISILVAITLTSLQTYGILEKIQTIIVTLLLLSVAVACIAARPDWLAAIKGTFIPTLPHYAEWVARVDPSTYQKPRWIELGVYLGAVGGGTYDYVGYLGLLREKKWGALGSNIHQHAADQAPAANQLIIDPEPTNLIRARRWLVPVKIDVGVSFICVLCFTIIFVLLGAAILHPNQLLPKNQELLSHQAVFLTHLHPSLLYLYQIGIFMAFWGTIYGAYEIYTRTTYECLMPLSSRLRRTPVKYVRTGVLLYCGITSLFLIWTTEKPMELVAPAAIVGGVMSFSIWTIALIWADRKFLPKPLRMGKFLLVLTCVSGIVLTLLGCRSLWGWTVRQLENSESNQVQQVEKTN